MPDDLTSHRADLAVRILSPEMDADKLGWTLKAVLARRATLGLGRFIGRRMARPTIRPATGHSKRKPAMRAKAAAKKQKRLVAKPR